MSCNETTDDIFDSDDIVTSGTSASSLMATSSCWPPLRSLCPLFPVCVPGTPGTPYLFSKLSWTHREYKGLTIVSLCFISQNGFSSARSLPSLTGDRQSNQSLCCCLQEKRWGKEMFEAFGRWIDNHICIIRPAHWVNETSINGSG